MLLKRYLTEFLFIKLQVIVSLDKSRAVYFAHFLIHLAYEILSGEMGSFVMLFSIN